MTTPTQGEHAKTELAHELFAAAQLAPGEGIEDAVSRIAAALTAAPADNEVLPLLIRDIANDLGKTAIEVMQVLRDTGHGNTSVNTAVTRSMAASLRKHFETATAQPAAPQGVAYAELRKEFDLWWNDQMGNEPGRDTSSDSRAFMPYKAWKKATERASNGQAPAGATPEDWNGTYEHAWRMGAQYIMETEAESKKMRQDAGFKWVYAPTAQAAPAAGITVEQVEDAIGLQSTAWDTIGAEKIVEAVLRLANARAPAAGAVAWPTRAEVANVFLANGFTVKEGQSDLKPYVYDAAYALLALAAAPTPAAQADSVLEDAERYRHLRDCNSGSLAVMQITGTGEDDWCILTEDDADAAIDAARKQGGTHDNH